MICFLLANKPQALLNKNIINTEQPTIYKKKNYFIVRSEMNYN